MMDIVNHMMTFLRLNLFSITKWHIQIQKKWMTQYIHNQNHYVQLTFGLIVTKKEGSRETERTQH